MKLLSVFEFAAVTVIAIGISLTHASFCGVMPIISAVLVIAFGIRPLQVTAAEPNPQYELGDIKIPAASADEEKREAVSLPLALDYLEKGTQVWNGHRKCVTCHTNGIYMTVRPALSDKLGKPTESVRQFFVETLGQLEGLETKKLLEATRPAQVIYTAAGLAEWDKHVTKQLSPETERALSLMFSIQRETGTWGTLDCWPPYESDAFHEATVAAMAAATAPGWLAKAKDEKLVASVTQLKQYLRTEVPPHDYSRTLLLWASTRMPELVDADRKAELIEMVFKHQREDGGWSIRTFAAPEAWGKGNRAARLNAEPHLANPPSDGHQTGLAVVVLREAGIEASEPRIQKAVAWLKSNQRVSGRWWTKSLNTDSWHFITYSGTAFPVLALSLCDAIPVETAANRQPIDRQQLRLANLYRR